jgi:tRNA(Ser,Leu) C12 N-acetylase TAN1
MVKLKKGDIIVSVHPHGFKHACRTLGQFGKIAETGYFNVLMLEAHAPDAFLERLRELVGHVPELLDVISRAIPLHAAFAFETAEELEANARDTVLGWKDRLDGKSFHVRVHRRGLRGRINSKDMEERLDTALLGALVEAGAAGRLAFTDPDVVIDMETLGNQAGLSIWTREDLQRYPFLRVD